MIKNKKIMQAYNPMTKSWIIYEKKGNRTLILDVKQKNPSIPFKGVTKKKK